MHTAFLMLGQFVIPTDNIRCIDQNYPRAAQDGGGTIVRVWLNSATPNLGQFTPPGHNLPNYLDFTGAQAQQIRRWCDKSVAAGQVTVVLSAVGETDPTKSTTKVGRPAKKTAKSTAEAATATS